MIDVKEIQVGNWVMRNDYIYPYPVKIVGIEIINADTMDYAVYVESHQNRIILLYPSELDYIPLTKEILVENGFTGGFAGDIYLYYDLGDGKFLSFYPHEKRLSMMWEGVDEWQNHTKVKDILFQCTCRYVHELQNALTLCEVKVEIIIRNNNGSN